MDLLDYDSEKELSSSPVQVVPNDAKDTPNSVNNGESSSSSLIPLFPSTSTTTKIVSSRSTYVPPDLLFLPVAGDWPCLVYIELPSKFLPVCQQLIQNTANILQLPLHSLINRIGNHTTSVVSSSSDPAIAVYLPLHISLSKVMTLRQHQISSFVQSLTNHINQEKISKFPLRLSETCILVNETRTRSFIGLAYDKSSTTAYHHHPVSSSSSSSPIGTVQRIIRQIDLTLTEYGKPCYYASPVIHVTIATTDGDITDRSTSYSIPIYYAPPSNESPSSNTILSVASDGSGTTTASDNRHASSIFQSSEIRAVESYLLQSRKSNNRIIDSQERRHTNNSDSDLPENVRNYKPIFTQPLPQPIDSEASVLSWTDKNSLSFTMDILVYEICCKIGNKVYRIPLLANA